MSTRARRIVPIGCALALLAIAIVFHRELSAWLSGRSVAERTGKAVTTSAGSFSITAALTPDPPAEKGTALVLDVKDATGKAIDDAKVDVAWRMPPMGAMAEMRGNATVTNEQKGRYRAVLDLPMAGSWTLETTIRTSEAEASQDFTMTVGVAGLSVAGTSAGAIDHYTCSMHPSVRANAPGRCPICNMDLVPVARQQDVVTIDEPRRQLIGVRTASVVSAPMKKTFRAVGVVSYDESALSDVSLKVRGWITKLYVDRTGQRVARGQTLFDLYSPELYNAEQDFLIASGDAGVRSEGFTRAARQRLQLLDVSETQIDQLQKRGSPARSVAFAAPTSGFVIEKNVVEGASIEPGARLYRIAVLNKVWVEAEVYEASLASVRVGQHADVTLDYVPGRTYEATVSYVYPYLDPKSRTGRVRVELANQDLELRPGMFANVTLSADLGARLQVPASAVVYTGPRRLVFVDLGQGRFTPREVAVGIESDGMYEVLGGLAPGDVVATSGVFLIAAEARISTAARYWERAPKDGGK